MLNLFYSRQIDVESAYIITLKGNDISEKLSKRCQQSCINVGMNYNIWEGFDGKKETIQIPEHSKNSDILKLIKITDHYLTKTEVACFLSHLSLWIQCCIIDKPIVILEHDSIMIEKFTKHQALNSIIYLGGLEWAKKNWKIYPIPPHASEGPNYLFICRAHAYSIDPLVAKNLVSHVIKYGISCPVDIFMRADIFNISHDGLYAYDLDDETTITNRPKNGRTTKRNDRLEY